MLAVADDDTEGAPVVDWKTKSDAPEITI